MGTNSIKSNLSRDDIISDIILEMGADIKKENVYILLEGKDDIRFLRSYVSENVCLYESYDGKNGVEYIVNEKFIDKKRVIGIRDKDYQENLALEKIFYYDYSCMELMLISNDDVFNKLCCEYYEGSIKSEELRMLILEQLKYLSILRMYNETEGWGVRFNGVSLNKAWDSKKHEIKNDVLIKKINLMNSDYIKGDVLYKTKAEYSKIWDEKAFYYNTQGHDFFTLFTTICNQYKKRGINYEDVQSCARCTFRNADFMNTKLYNELKEYSDIHSLKILCN